jgi:uncharacterized protein YbjT (DUF2867 family)
LGFDIYQGLKPKSCAKGLRPTHSNTALSVLLQPSKLKNSMSKLLVLGGTGFVGRSLCERWLEQSGGAARIVVPTRRSDRGRTLQSLPGVEVVQADVHDMAQLRRLVAGCDLVVNLIAILHGHATDFEGVHVDFSRKVIGVCNEAGSVHRVVHISALGASAKASSLYLRSKARGEALWLASGLEVTVLRPSVIFGAADRFMNLFAQAQSVLPVFPLACAQARFQPVWVEDVAQAIVVSLLDQGVHPVGTDATRPIFECTGPRIYTLAELVRLAGQWSGHARPVLPLPSALAYLQALVMEMLPGEPLMSRDNLASMRAPNVATGRHPGLTDLGIAPTALESVAPLYLSQTAGPDRLLPWRAYRRRS